MTELLTAAQMKAIEQAAIASGEVTGLELMERAGQGVVEAIFEKWPEFKNGQHWATILCGPGNNGGDGYVVARILSEMGWYTDVLYFGDPQKLPSDARANYEKYCQKNDAHEMSFRTGSAIFETETDLVIDAVFGTGLERPLDDVLGEVLACDLAILRDHEEMAKCVAVDIPSGLSADTGEVLSDGGLKEAFKANLTVTFHRAKVGHFKSDGPEYCGEVVVSDIGL